MRMHKSSLYIVYSVPESIVHVRQSTIMKESKKIDYKKKKVNHFRRRKVDKKYQKVSRNLDPPLNVVGPELAIVRSAISCSC